jgi:hypothetical protein
MQLPLAQQQLLPLLLLLLLLQVSLLLNLPAGRSHKGGSRAFIIAPRALSLYCCCHSKVANAHRAITVNQNVASLANKAITSNWLSPNATCELRSKCQDAGAPPEKA